MRAPAKGLGNKIDPAGKMDLTASLSDTLLQRILLQLPESSRAPCSLVCHRWLRVVGQLHRSLRLLDWNFLESGRLTHRFPHLTDLDLTWACMGGRNPQNPQFRGPYQQTQQAVILALPRHRLVLPIYPKVPREDLPYSLEACIRTQQLTREAQNRGLSILASGCPELKCLRVVDVGGNNHGSEGSFSEWEFVSANNETESGGGGQQQKLQQQFQSHSMGVALKDEDEERQHQEAALVTGNGEEKDELGMMMIDGEEMLPDRNGLEEEEIEVKRKRGELVTTTPPNVDGDEGKFIQLEDEGAAAPNFEGYVTSSNALAIRADSGAADATTTATGVRNAAAGVAGEKDSASNAGAAAAGTEVGGEDTAVGSTKGAGAGAGAGVEDDGKQTTTDSDTEGTLASTKGQGKGSTRQTGGGEVGLVSLARGCPLLQELEVHQCTDETIMSVVACQNVQSLKLVGTVPGFSSCSFTDVGLTILASQCHRLMKLELSGCEASFAGIAAIGQCCLMLEELVLSTNTAGFQEGWVAALGYFESLKALRLEDCKYIDPRPGPEEHMKRCQSLERLHLVCCDLRDQVGFAALLTLCANVRELEFQDCWGLDDEIFALAAKCRKLRVLSLDGCSLVTIAGLETVVLACKELQRLRVVYCSSIRDEEMSPAFADVVVMLKEFRWRPDTKTLLSSTTEIGQTGRKFILK